MTWNWSDFAGAALSTGGSLLSGLMSDHASAKSQARAYAYARLLQQHQYDLMQQGYREGPTNARQGLVSAGYNPILAVNQGSNFAANVSGGTPVSGTNINTPDLGSSFSNAYQTFRLNKQTVANQTVQTQANVGLANAQAENQIQQAITEAVKRKNIEFDSMMKDAQTHALNEKLPYEVRKLNQEIYNIMQDSELKRAIASVQAYNAETNRISANATVTNANASASNAETNRNATITEQEYRDKHPIYNFVDRWSKALSPWAMPAVIGTQMNKNSVTDTTSYKVNAVTGEVKNVKKSHSSRRRK